MIRIMLSFKDQTPKLHITHLVLAAEMAVAFWAAFPSPLQFQPSVSNFNKDGETSKKHLFSQLWKRDKQSNRPNWLPLR